MIKIRIESLFIINNKIGIFLLIVIKDYWENLTVNR